MEICRQYAKIREKKVDFQSGYEKKYRLILVNPPGHGKIDQKSKTKKIDILNMSPCTILNGKA